MIEKLKHILGFGKAKLSDVQRAGSKMVYTGLASNGSNLNSHFIAHGSKDIPEVKEL